MLMMFYVMCDIYKREHAHGILCAAGDIIYLYMFMLMIYYLIMLYVALYLYALMLMMLYLCVTYKFICMLMQGVSCYIWHIHALARIIMKS